MTIHFIGAGPGAADLITVRGLNLIRHCPVVLYAGSLVPPAIVAEARADAPFQPRQIPAAADVREQADPGFGHRKARMFGRDTIFRRLRNADPAAHGNAVHEGDDGLRIGEKQMVEAIFGVEELPRHLKLLLGLLAEAEAAGQIAPQPALLRLTFLMGAVMGPVLVAAMLKDGGVLPALVRRQVMPQVLSDAAIAQRIDLALRALVQGVPND